MLREKKCRWCGKTFFYDDGLTELGLAAGTGHVTNPPKQQGQEVNWSYCPRCDDPQFLAGMSYSKDAILFFFGRYLKRCGIDVQILDKEDIVEMMKNFPRTYSTYTSNGTYRTITLFPGTRFPGQYGEFEMGISFALNPLDAGLHRVYYQREIICIRCNTKSNISIYKVLCFYLGLKEKLCRKCDCKHYLIVPPNKRNMRGLNRNGSEKKEYSDRALAKALNVSRMDFRRNKITAPVPALPIGSRVRSFVIKSAYWDEDPASYSPKYLVECIECKEQFRVVQKQVYNLTHFCKKLGRMI